MKTIQLWRWKVSITLMFAAFIGMWAFSPWGWTTTMDVRESIEPVQKDVSELKSAIKEEQRTNREILAVLTELRSVSIGDQVRRLVALRCRLSGYERDEVQRDIDEAQRRYNAFAHIGNYPEPVCEPEPKGK